MKPGTGRRGREQQLRREGSVSDGRLETDSGRQKRTLGPVRSRGAAGWEQLQERPGWETAEEEAQAPRLEGSCSARGP